MGLCFKLLAIVSGQEREEAAAILEVHHLYYLVMVSQLVCLPIRDSV